MKGLIGLEIHTYLLTKEKLFCRCRASRERGIQSNTLICEICTGQPGAKPMAPNAEAVKNAVQIGLMLGCKINNETMWMRKHYSWPDLPKGYQTTMSGAHATPLGTDGTFENIRISSMHLEEDPASWEPQTGYVDYNRSGLPLVEIVTAPEFHFAEEATEWLEKLAHALSYLKTVDANAGIKVDVNVNLISPKKTERVEIKNITSIESIGKAIEYELERQLREGSVRETRRYDEAKGKTIAMRSKEQQDDYRFIADPDLQAVVLDKKTVDELKKKLPEMPEAKLKKLITKHKIDKKNAEVLAKNIDIAEFFEQVVEEGKVKADFALHWITGELLRVLNWNKKMLYEVDINIGHFIELLKMVESGLITELQAKGILNKFIPKSFSPLNSEGKISDKKELEKVVMEVIKKNKKAAEDYKKGDENIFNYLMGEVMKATERRADYKVARAVLEKMLNPKKLI